MLLAAVLCLLLIGGCMTPARRNDDAASLSAQREEPARSALVEVDGEAGFTVTEVVRINGDVRVDYTEALNLLARGDSIRGIALLVEVTDKAPLATAPFVDLGIAYSRAGVFEKAQLSFSHALASTPDHPVVHNELGIVYRKLGRFAAARKSYERALAVYPGFHYARRNLAVLCDLYLADKACALEHYEIYRQAVSTDRDVDIWINDLRNRIPTTE
ncbi:MAG: tetratricopeptide repeat protein [Gammaproteobacteria bacterium]|nr:tetratricopeptide repeat protein [Gammaproteobacteria bacterium]